MIVLSVIALLLALVAVIYFAGQSSAKANLPPGPLDPFDPLSPANPISLLDPSNPLSPMWTPQSDTASDSGHGHHPHASSPTPHASDPTPRADCAPSPDVSSLSPDPGSFDAGSHHSH